MIEFIFFIFYHNDEHMFIIVVKYKEYKFNHKIEIEIEYDLATELYCCDLIQFRCPSTIIVISEIATFGVPFVLFSFIEMYLARYISHIECTKRINGMLIISNLIIPHISARY